jgi:hypothetical protein
MLLSSRIRDEVTVGKWLCQTEKATSARAAIY